MVGFVERKVGCAVAVYRPEGGNCGFSLSWARVGAGNRSPHVATLPVKASSSVNLLDGEPPGGSSDLNRADECSAEDANEATERGMEEAPAERALERQYVLGVSEERAPVLSCSLSPTSQVTPASLLTREDSNWWSPVSPF